MSRPELVLVFGVLLLLVGLLWARGARRRRDAEDGLKAALHATDPLARVAGLMLAAEGGVSRNAESLLAVARGEKDEKVLDALARLVARHQWEPASQPAAIELRLWAQEYLSGNRNGGEPAGPPTAPEATLELPPGLAEALAAPPPPPAAAAVDEAPAPEAPAPSFAAPLPEHSPPTARLARVLNALALRLAPDEGLGHNGAAQPRLPTVLVTGAGGAAGVSVIRALRASGLRVVAADPDDTAVGLQLADAAGSVPLADDPAFVPAVCELARSTGAGALMSTVSEELPALAEGRAELAQAGLATWLPDPAAVRVCLDKLAFSEALAAAGISHPRTSEGALDGLPAPWLVKPRFGRGSRDVYPVDSAAELEWALRRTPHPLVQSRLEGVEFTIDALVDRDGSLAGAVPRWRLETKAGISTKGRTFEDPALLAELETLLRALHLEGPANVQGFVLSADGSVVFTEVNPRFSGGLALSLAAGAELVGEYLRGITGLPLRRERLRYRAGVTMERYYEEVILG